jgi:hypothetical protein
MVAAHLPGGSIHQLRLEERENGLDRQRELF